MAQAARSQSPQEQIARDIAGFAFNPYGFVLYAYPWGKSGTILAQHDGPDAWQRDVLVQLGEELLEAKSYPDRYGALQYAVASGHGIGKAQGINDLALTPDGIRRWGDLQPGDRVFGADGAPTAIVATRHYEQIPFYRVTFDDRSFLDVSSGHLWTVRGRQERRKGLDTWRTLETVELLELGVKRKNGANLARQWEIPIQGPAQFEPREIDLHPYFVGLWLGDGSKGQPVICKPYEEVFDRLRGFEYEVTICPDGKTHYVRNISHLLTDPVFGCGSHERYIPEDYKLNSVENRMELLRGLLDSDGEIQVSGSIGYSSSSKQLAEDVIWLARSLGCKAMMQPTVKKPFYTNGDGAKVAGKDSYRVTINAPFNPFTVEHKRERYKPSEPRYLKRWIESIEPVGVDDGMCISVANEDGLYQAAHFIVTHNSAFMSWLIQWFMSTQPNPNVVATANTRTQLLTKLWRELSRWHKLMINEDWFEWTATSFFHKSYKATWKANAIPWSETNPEAFAGLHEDNVMVLYDEASAVHDVIWETTEGAMTTPGALWIATGNPTRNSGRFRECFPGGRFEHRWRTWRVDSRRAKMTNKAQLQQWVDDYGEDSDFVRVRVKGQFPRAGTAQFVPSDIVLAGQNRTVEGYEELPKVMGVDVARFGDDESVILLRQGPRAFDPFRYRGLDTMQYAAEVARKIDMLKPDAVMVDGVGVGGGVVDRLRQLGYRQVVDVQVGTKAYDEEKYFNRRAEIWALMREWLRGEVELPKHRDFHDQLVSVEYGLDMRERIQLEKKTDIKKRGLASPDLGDALALTFAEPVHVVQRSRFSRPQALRSRNTWRYV